MRLNDIVLLVVRATVATALVLIIGIVFGELLGFWAVLVAIVLGLVLVELAIRLRRRMR